MKQNEHGGNIHRLIRQNRIAKDRLIDFSANINPAGPPKWFRSLINRELGTIVHYPDPECVALKETIARKYRVDAKRIVPANGTTELLHLLPRVLEKKDILIPEPSYIDYRMVFQAQGYRVHSLMLTEESGYCIDPDVLAEKLGQVGAVIFANPTNPAGALISSESIVSLAEAFRQTLFIIDEAFYPFYTPFSTVGGKCGNLITLNSLTKFFAIPGLRAGFGIFPEWGREKIRRLLPQWSVNSLAQSFAVTALEDDAYCRDSCEACARLRENLFAEINTIPGLKAYPSAANFLLLRSGNQITAKKLYEKLLSNQMIIRRCDNYRGLDEYSFRIAVRSAQENQRLLEALRLVYLLPGSGKQRFRRKTPALMFQGTSSNAGKSILAAALCRILFQDGVKVAPFKAQNMSLNSYVTWDGGEMGRAQVVQAFASRIDPEWRMNPVLLKPNSDTGSQVIINGHPVGNMNVLQYHRYKKEAWEAVRKSYDELSSQYDCMVLEGAGSSGEVNLKKHDIVNMRMADYCSASVLLVGDIDRGGVYASFAGIMDVLEEWERTLVDGFIVNKFRGDQRLLDDAHRFIHFHTGRHVLGVIPYIADLSVPEEDSVSFKDGFYGYEPDRDKDIVIAVVDLPHISNFTDIDALASEPDVSVFVARNETDLTAVDCVILPGSKNVGGDLAYLEEKGICSRLIELAARGKTIVGICGGYQMLGKQIEDPCHLESERDSFHGIGLIDVSTMLDQKKILVRKEGIHRLSGLKVSGYEIHHGRTETLRNPVITYDDGSVCGTDNNDNTVWGVYLHGIFDEDAFRRWFINGLRAKKGLQPQDGAGVSWDLDLRLDKLAAIVRDAIDIDTIYKNLNL